MAVDAVVVGAGHNGLVAATLLARAGWTVEVLEQSDVAGGAVGSSRTPAGHVHDWGSAFYGVLHSSPVLRELGLDTAVPWARTEVPLASLYRPGTPAALLHADPERTAEGLGSDGDAWRELYRWWQRAGAAMFTALMTPLPGPLTLARGAGSPRGAVQLARTLLEPLEAHAAHLFLGEGARMLLAGHATHADVAVDGAGSTPPALLLAMAAQQHGMPVPVGGAATLALALVQAAESAGAVVRTDVDVTQVVVRAGRAVGVRTADGGGVGARRAVLFSGSPHVLARDLVGERHLPAAWLRQLSRHRYGSGFLRVDVDLDRPAPWADPRVRDASVVHVTGDVDELALSQAQVRRGLLPEHPQLVVGQQDRADPSRVPPGAASLWVECHCPARPRGQEPGWEQRLTERVLDRLEQHAPGLRDGVVAVTTHAPLDLQARDPALVGGDVAGGSAALDQLSVLRPVAGWSPYAVPVRGLYLCGAATAPGGGVHGMSGRSAARVVLRRERLGALRPTAPAW